MNLTSDTFYTVARNLDGGELMKMCSANNETRRICTSVKFNPIWAEKLLKDFNVKYQGSNAYMEYLQHAYLYKQSYWTATVFNKNDNAIVTSKIFKNNSDAVTFLANEAMKYHILNPEATQPKYITYLATIGQQGTFEDVWNKYEVNESEFETKPQETENYNNYMTKLKDLYNLLISFSGSHQISENLEKDFEHFRMEFETIISEEHIEDDEDIEDDDDIEDDEDYEGIKVWERFRDEILPSYIDKKLDKKKNNEIKTTLMKIIA